MRAVPRRLAKMAARNVSARGVCPVGSLPAPRYPSPGKETCVRIRATVFPSAANMGKHGAPSAASTPAGDSELALGVLRRAKWNFYAAIFPRFFFSAPRRSRSPPPCPPTLCRPYQAP